MIGYSSTTFSYIERERGESGLVTLRTNFETRISLEPRLRDGQTVGLRRYKHWEKE